jgi:hypothetical protein
MLKLSLEKACQPLLVAMHLNYFNYKYFTLKFHFPTKIYFEFTIFLFEAVKIKNTQKNIKK